MTVQSSGARAISLDWKLLLAIAKSVTSDLSRGERSRYSFYVRLQAVAAAKQGYQYDAAGARKQRMSLIIDFLHAVIAGKSRKCAVIKLQSATVFLFSVVYKNLRDNCNF